MIICLQKHLKPLAIQIKNLIFPSIKIRVLKATLLITNGLNYLTQWTEQLEAQIEQTSYYLKRSTPSEPNLYYLLPLALVCSDVDVKSQVAVLAVAAIS